MKNPNLPFDTKNFYNKHGFNLLKNIFVKEIKKIKEEIHNYLIYFGKRNKLINGNENYDDLVQKIMIPGSKLRTFIYDSVPLLNSIQDLKRNNYIRKHLHKLGFKNPVAFDMGTVRFDINKKEETKFLRGIHQDIRSIKTKKTITVWIPLVEVNNINGTVVIYPGTQNYGLLNHIYDPNLLIPEDQLPKTIKYLEKKKFEVHASPGDLCIFNCFVLHRSEPAKIDFVRSVIQFTFFDISEFDEKDNLFFLSSEYKPFAKKDDQLKKISTLN